MEKEINIIAPDGYEIDRANSTLECIRFKPVSKIINTITHLCFSPESVKINGKRGMVIFSNESAASSAASGHNASLYLASDSGNWFDEEGNKINGYVFYAPTERK